VFRQDLSEPFGRTMGCTARELRGWLVRALPGARLAIEGDDDEGLCRARFEDGELHIAWRTLAPRRIALLSIPQLQVRFHYTGLSPQRRRDVQDYFDRATQRGGG